MEEGEEEERKVEGGQLVRNRPVVCLLSKSLFLFCCSFLFLFKKKKIPTLVHGRILNWLRPYRCPTPPAHSPQTPLSKCVPPDP